MPCREFRMYDQVPHAAEGETSCNVYLATHDRRQGIAVKGNVDINGAGSSELVVKFFVSEGGGLKLVAGECNSELVEDLNKSEDDLIAQVTLDKFGKVTPAKLGQVTLAKLGWKNRKDGGILLEKIEEKLRDNESLDLEAAARAVVAEIAAAEAAAEATRNK